MTLLESIKLNHIFTAALFLFFVTAAPAIAQINGQDSEFNTWDANGDSTLSQDEFNSGLTEMGYYAEWDADGNGELSEEEWNAGVEDNLSSFDAEDYGAYSDWDADGDGVASEEEFGEGLFDTLDEDDDDAIAEEEFNSWFEDGLF